MYPVLCGTCLFTVRELSNFVLWKIMPLQGLLHLANRSNRRKKGIVKNSGFSFWLRVSEIVLLKLISKDLMTPTSVMMCFWSGCQVEGLWCKPHYELTRIFKLLLRECFQNQWRCLFLGGFFFKWDSLFYQNDTESPLLWTNCSHRKCCCSPCSVFLQSLPVLISGNAGESQLILLFHLHPLRVCRGIRKTAPGEGSSKALLGGGRTIIYMKIPFFFF